jgi:phage protein D
MARGRISVKKTKGVGGKAASKVGKFIAELGAIQELLKAARKLKKPVIKSKKVSKKKADSRKKAKKSIAAKKGARTKWIKKNYQDVRYDDFKRSGVLPSQVPILTPDELQEAMDIAGEFERERQLTAGGGSEGVELVKRPFREISSQKAVVVTPLKKTRD